jgi:hypothetical protein
MPIPIEEYAQPRFLKIPDRWPMSYDKSDRFNEINPRHNVRRYMGSEGREGGWKAPGYNPNHDSTSLERINLRTDNMTYRPY